MFKPHTLQASFWFFLFALFFIGSFCLFFYSNLCGVTSTLDSFFYISAAKSYQQSGIMLNPNGSIYYHWPPLFPFILTVIKFEQENRVIWLQILSVFGSIFIMVSFARKLIQELKLVFLYACTLLFGTPLLLITNFMWSEPVFLLLLSLHFYVLYAFSKADKNQKWLLVALIILDNLLCTQRNAGIIFIVATTITLLYLLWKTKGILLYTCIYACLSSAAFFYWNFKFGHGREHISALINFELFVQKLNNYLIVLGSWFLPQKIYLAGIILFTILMVSFFSICRNTFQKLLQNKLFVLLAINMMVYLAISLSFPTPSFSALDRYYAIIYPAFFLLLFVLIDNLHSRLPKIRQCFLLIIIALWMAYPITKTIKNAVFWHNSKCISYSEKLSPH